MATVFQRFSMALKAAVSAFRDPGMFPGEMTTIDRRPSLNLLWSMYANTQFENVAQWESYRAQNQLYRNIRSIYNPTRRIVNFYVAQVYPGVLSEDASKLPDGVQLAIPLSEDTDDKLKSAIAQFWQWSNWQSGNKLMVRYGGAVGSCLVEVFDNVERGKITTRVHWPGLLALEAIDGGPPLVLDDVGNVKFFALEWDAIDENGTSFTYRKEVSQETISYYRDDVLFAPEGSEAQVDNPYGFVPAVWCKHIDEGDDFGIPAIAGSIIKIDELNSLVSHVHDHIDKVIESPGIIGSSGPVGTIGADSTAIKNAQSEFNADNFDKQKPTKRLLLKGPADTTWIPMVGNLKPDDTIKHMQQLLAEIESDFPELKFWEKVRGMTTISGVAIDKISGDVKGRVLEVAGNYDQQSVKLFQMATAIGGMRLAEGKGGWKDKTSQRLKFAPFGLDSYERGLLDTVIMPRPLVPLTEDDQIDATGKRLDNAKKAQGIFPDDKILEVAGISDPDERAEMLQQRATEAQNAPMIAKSAIGGAPPGIQGMFGAQALPPGFAPRQLPK